MWVDTSIEGCGWIVWGDATNADDLDTLEGLRATWKASKCGAPGSVCGVGGHVAKPATCEASGQGGTLGTCISPL